MPKTLPSAAAIAGVGSLICLLLTAAALALTLVGLDRTGALSVFESADPARFDEMRSVWGLLLASEIVRLVLALAFLATAWALHGAVPLRSWRGAAALAAGTLGGVLSVIAGRQGIVAAAELGMGIAPGNGEVVAVLALAGLACIGIWVALVAFEAWRSAELPRSTRDIGIATALLAIAAAVYPPAGLLLALMGMVWWVGLARMLLDDRPRLTA